jgi:gliding motility-associated-like protein
MKFTISILLSLVGILTLSAQPFTTERLYRSEGISGNYMVSSTVIDKKDAQYSLLHHTKEVDIDSAGYALKIKHQHANNDTLVKNYHTSCIKYDSLGGYQYHIQIKQFHNRDSFLDPIINMRRLVIETSKIKIDEQNNVILSIPSYGSDSIQIVNRYGEMVHTIYNEFNNTNDSSTVILLKLTSVGDIVWLKWINVSFTRARNAGYSGSYAELVNSNILVDSNNHINWDFDFNDKNNLQHQSDTLWIHTITDITPIVITSRNTGVRFSASGNYLSEYKLPFSLKGTNDSNIISVAQSVYNGSHIYRLIQIYILEDDTLLTSIGNEKLLKGEHIILTKENATNQLIWIEHVGIGSNLNMCINFDINKRQILLALNFHINSFQFTLPTTKPTHALANVICHIGIYNEDGERVGNKTFGNTMSLLGIYPYKLTNGFFIVGRNLSEGTVIDSLVYNHSVLTTVGYIAHFDSSYRCVYVAPLLRDVRVNTRVSLGLETRISDALYKTPAHPIINSKGNIFLSGEVIDSLNLPCSTYHFVAGLSPGFVIKSDKFILIDSNVCDSMLSPSRRFVWDTTGVYYDTISSVNNCDSILVIRLKVLHNKSTIDTTLCSRYKSPSGKYSTDTSAVIHDTIPNMHGCDSILTINVTIRQNKSTVDTVLCSAYESPSGKYKVDSSTTIIDTIPNSYGCDSVITIRVTIQSNNVFLDTSYCNDMISPSGKYVYSSSGVYTDTLINSKHCDSIININYTKTPTHANLTIKSCKPYTLPSGKYIIDSTGLYYDTIPTIQQCDSVLTINYEFEAFKVTASKSNNITCDSPSAILQVNRGLTFSWMPVESLNNSSLQRVVASPKKNKTYVVTVIDSSGCEAIDSVVIDVNLHDSITILPNVFTPNNDGINDCLSLEKVGNFKSVHLTIFNRWGNIVYETNHSNACWDGTNKTNLPVDEGVYYFVLTGVSSCNNPVKQTGTLHLIR